MAIYPATKHESIQWQEGGFEPGTSGFPAPSTGYAAYTSPRKQPPFFAPHLICPRPSVVGDERKKKKKSQREKGERIVPCLSLPLVFSFLSLALYFSLVPLFSSIYVKSSSTSLQIPRYLFELCTYILFLSVWIILCTVTCL